ncbi:MAG: porin family protein [Beijerinckiaceae bacterium]|nr:porin family protein [Beijerinckiaceae bacterium]
MKISALAATASFIVCAVPALSADLLSPTRVFTAPQVWNGAYIGLQAGHAWASTPIGLYAVVPPNIAYDDLDPKGLTYGVHAGYDWQFSGLVLGVMADAELSSIKKKNRGVTIGAFFIPANGEVNIAWQGALRARVGYVVVPDLLVYATGGMAFSNLEVVTTFPAPGSNSETMTGWTVGAGLSYALTRSFFVSAEYRYTAFGKFERPIAAPFIARTELDSQSVRVGLSYRFGG